VRASSIPSPPRSPTRNDAAGEGAARDQIDEPVAAREQVGVRPRGDLSESRPEWVLTDAACMFATAIDVPIYPTLTAPQVRYILKDSGARVLVIQNEEKFPSRARRHR